MNNNNNKNKIRCKLYTQIMIFIIILSIFVIALRSDIPKVNAVIKEWKYKWTAYQINASSDDCYYIINQYFDLTQDTIYLKVLNYDVEAGLRFLNIQLMGNSTIDIAMLSLYTDDPEVENDPQSFTLYGIKGNPSTFINASDFENNKTPTWEWERINPYDELQGVGWHNISVTYLVRGIVYNVEKNGVWVNGSLGFKSMGYIGGEYIKVRSYDHNTSLAAKLYIREKYYISKTPSWLTDMYPPDEGWVLDLDRDYRGLDVWSVSSMLDYTFWNTSQYYDNINLGLLDDEKIIETISDDGIAGHIDKILRNGKNIFYVGQYNSSFYLWHSKDEGDNWAAYRVNSYIPQVTSKDSSEGAIAIDSNEKYHLVWTTSTDDMGNSSSVVWVAHTYFTIVNDTVSWSGVIDYPSDITFNNYHQKNPDIYIDANNIIHATWHGGRQAQSWEQIWYKYYDTDNTWKGFKMVSQANQVNRNPSITSSQDSKYIFITWDLLNDDVYYRLKNDGSWESIVHFDWDYCRSIDSIIDKDNNRVYMAYEKNGRIAYKYIDLPSGSLSSRIWLTNVVGATSDVSLCLDHFNDKVLFMWDNGTYGISGRVRLSSGSLEDSFTVSQKMGNNPNVVNYASININITYYYVHDPREDSDTYCEQINPDPFDDVDDVDDWIDWYVDSSTDYDRLPQLGSNIMWMMGLIGLGMIPLSFIMFIHCVQQGDIMNGFYLLMVIFFIGLGLVVGWLWG